MSLRIIKAGLLDTVQDWGRYGYQHLGVGVGGVMDRFSAGLANALLGKPLTDAVLELYFPAPVLAFEKSTVIALTGADFTPVLGEQEVALNQPLAVGAGNVLRFRGVRRGAWCYLSVLHGLALEPWLGSYSTHLRAGAGGWKGRALQEGDVLAYRAGADIAPPFHDHHLQPLPWKTLNPHVTSTASVPVVFGSEWCWLTEEAKETFRHSTFYVSPSSDRTAYRLVGEPLKTACPEQLVSSAVSYGTVQLLPSGEPLVLMADCQTTGGYPRIAHVLTAGLPALAQRKPHEGFRFQLTTMECAEAELRAQQDYLEQLRAACDLKIKNWLHAPGH